MISSSFNGRKSEFVGFSWIHPVPHFSWRCRCILELLCKWSVILTFIDNIEVSGHRNWDLMNISLTACFLIWTGTFHTCLNCNIVETIIAILIFIYDLLWRFKQTPALIGGSSALPLSLPSLQTTIQGKPNSKKTHTKKD